MNAVILSIALLIAPPASQSNAAMQAIARALGVECVHCHVQDDWTNDSQPGYAVARKMIQMVKALNENQLAEVDEIACWTCHAGQTKPSRLPPDLLTAQRAAWPASLADAPDGLNLAMSVYTVTLGVKCDHCHDTANWKADDKPAFKMVARMAAMFDEFPKYMPATARTQCWMCHKGSVKPARKPPAP